MLASVDELDAAIQRALFSWPQGRPVWWSLNPTVAFVLGAFPSLT